MNKRDYHQDITSNLRETQKGRELLKNYHRKAAICSAKLLLGTATMTTISTLAAFNFAHQLTNHPIAFVGSAVIGIAAGKLSNMIMDNAQFQEFGATNQMTNFLLDINRNTFMDKQPEKYNAYHKQLNKEDIRRTYKRNHKGSFSWYMPFGAALLSGAFGFFSSEQNAHWYKNPEPTSQTKTSSHTQKLSAAQVAAFAPKREFITLES